MSQVLVPVPGSSQLGEPSFLNLIGTVKPYSPSPYGSDHKGRGIVIRSTCLSSNSESDVQTGDRWWLAGEIVTDGGPCLVCPVEHSPCDICYKFHHFYHCPYLDRGVPKGASFNPRYELVCSCGNIFNEAKWTCTMCFGSHPVLKRKDCSICGAMAEHSSHECQVDKARSDGYKRYREELFSDDRKMIPYPPPEFSQLNGGIRLTM